MSSGARRRAAQDQLFQQFRRPIAQDLDQFGVEAIGVVVEQVLEVTRGRLVGDRLLADRRQHEADAFCVGPAGDGPPQRDHALGPAPDHEKNVAPVHQRFAAVRFDLERRLIAGQGLGDPAE